MGSGDARAGTTGVGDGEVKAANDAGERSEMALLGTGGVKGTKVAAISIDFVSAVRGGASGRAGRLNLRLPDAILHS